MVPAGNKAKRLSSVNHATKTIHHHHPQQIIFIEKLEKYEGATMVFVSESSRKLFKIFL